MHDHRHNQLQKVKKQKLVLIASNISQDAFVSGSYARRWPTGAVYMWALQAVYGPQGIAEQMKDAAE